MSTSYFTKQYYLPALMLFAVLTAWNQSRFSANFYYCTWFL